MPTDKQLFDSWSSQFQSSKDIGIVEDQITDLDINGKVIGSIEFDPIEKELKITLGD